MGVLLFYNLASDKIASNFNGSQPYSEGKFNMTVWDVSIGVRGTDGAVATLNIAVDADAVLPADQFAQASTAAEEIATAIESASDGAIAFVRVAKTLSSSAAFGNGEVYAKASLVVATLNGTEERTGIFNLPAPKIGVFAGTSGPGMNVIDTGDALLADLIAALADGNALLSDGETIDTTRGTSGLMSGRRVIVRRKLPTV